MPDIAAIDFSPEWRFQTSRSRGAGGQNVNKVESRVELFFDINQSQLLSDVQKEKLKKRASAKIDTEGVLHLAAEESRSQLKNKEIVTEKFYALLIKAFTEQKVRKATRPSKGAIERRIQSKKRNSQKKQNRRGLE